MTPKTSVSIKVFDPAMCCSTGLCGVDVDQKLVNFAADVDWLKGKGGAIERFNLAQQAQAFVDDPNVRAVLHDEGQDVLPITIVEGEVVLTGRYGTRAELAEWAGLPAAPSIFTDQVAELVAIGAAIASNCEPCFSYHFDQARRLGVSDADMLKSVELAQQVTEIPARSIVSLARRQLGAQPAKRRADSVALPLAAEAAAACCSGEKAEANSDKRGSCC